MHPVVGRVLIAHRGSWCGVSGECHELGDRGAGDGGVGQSCVPQVVEVKVVSTCSLAGAVPAVPGALDGALLRSSFVVDRRCAVDRTRGQMRS